MRTTKVCNSRKVLNLEVESKDEHTEGFPTLNLQQ